MRGVAGLRNALLAAVLCGIVFVSCAGAQAQTFPPLTGPVVDAAQVLPPEAESEFAIRLEAHKRASSGHEKTTIAVTL